MKHQLAAVMAKLEPIKNPVITGTKDATPESAFASLITGLVGMILTVATIWTLVQLLIGGINWISSGGDKGKLELARGRIMNAIIGLLIVFASWSIFLLILNFLGISPVGEEGGFQLKIPTLL